MPKKTAPKLPVVKAKAPPSMKNNSVAKNKVFGATVKPKDKPFGSFGGAKRAARATNVKQASREKRLASKPL